MNKPDEIVQIYERNISEAEKNIAWLQSRIYHVGTVRLLLFIAGIAGIFYFWKEEWPIIGIISAITFLPFLFLIRYHNRLFYQKEYLEKKVEINGQELMSLKNDISSFDDGKEFVNPEHLYSYDLDLFGKHSLFQCLNRTSTEMGRKELAKWLNNHLQDVQEIEERQYAVKELAPELQFRQRFRILGLLYSGKKADEEEIKNWAKSPSYYRNKKIIRILPFLALTINVVAILLAMIGVIPFGIPGILFAGFFLLSFCFTKNINRIQNMYGKKMQILATYAKLISSIEEKEVKSEALKKIKMMVGSNKKAASKSIRELSKLMNALDQRNNMFMSAIRNGLMLWELKQIMRIEQWKEECAESLPKWLEAIGYMDAFCSLATFCYNNPDYTFPEISKQGFKLQATALGHPLMNKEKCVCNDIDVEKRPFFTIITGANMAGKSTYLRTIGINYLLACIGAPIFGSKMSISPVKLVTSLRTTDSLTDNESYFFAELKRLKLIINMLHNGDELFIILDEILKGTNSVDKQKGSIALIKQFMSLGTNGIIATHDLMLGSLSELFPENVRNCRFEADIINDELSFSYQLREGIAENMNACFLMKKMGITID